MVDYFGSPTPLNQLAGVTVSGAQSLVVTPYDKSAFKLIETAIMESGLGLMPTNEGTLLRLNIPPLTGPWSVRRPSRVCVYCPNQHPSHEPHYTFIFPTHTTTEDRRKEMAKQAKGVGEEGKVAVRNIRRDAVDKIKKLEKDKAIGKDERADGEDAVQKLTDKYTKAIEEMLKAKEKEIMTV